MTEKLSVAWAEIIESGLTTGRAGKTILGTFTVAGKEKFALLAIFGKILRFLGSKSLLPRAVKHFYQGFFVNVSQSILRKNKVIAAIDISIELHHRGMTAMRRQTAETGLLTYPIGQRRVENLHKIAAYIFLDPFIKNCTEKASPLFGRDGFGRQRQVAGSAFIGEVAFAELIGSGQMAAVGLWTDTNTRTVRFTYIVR